MAKVPGLREQIISALCDVQMAAADKTSRTGNIIVMGEQRNRKDPSYFRFDPCNLQANLIWKRLKWPMYLRNRSTAKISRRSYARWPEDFLLSRTPTQLKKETANQLSKAMEFRTDGMIVILEDEKIGMRKLMARFPKFTSKFTSVINIPVFTNDELVNFAKVYTRENGCTIDQMAMLTLYNLISTKQKDDQPMNVGAVKEIIDNAISKSRGGIRKLKRNISKKRTDSDGYFVLYEKDFN